MNILYLTKYSRLGASSRMRSFQYFPYLRQQGLKVTVKPLFGDQYLSASYSKESTLILVVKSYAKRFFLLLTMFSYERIVIEKELFPYFPPFFEWLLYYLGIEYIVDYDDAIFHNYDQHPNRFFRKILRNKIDKVMKYSSIVIAGNGYLAERAKIAGARNIHIIPTVVDLERYRLKSHNDHQPIVIGWIGTQSTFEKCFVGIKEIIRQTLEQFLVEFHIVGVTQDLGLGNRVKYIPWSEDTEVASILSFDIGIMPLEDSPWEKGKCAYKLIQYMACGLPVIASPVGMNKEVVKNKINGYLVQTDGEWLEAFERYILNLDLRINHGKAGVMKVEQYYCLEKTKIKMAEILS